MSIYDECFDGSIKYQKYFTGKSVPEFRWIDKLEKYDFSFGPNPTGDFIYLSATESIGNVEIYNLLGQKSFSSDLRDNMGTIDISNLSDGGLRRYALHSARWRREGARNDERRPGQGEANEDHVELEGPFLKKEEWGTFSSRACTSRSTTRPCTTPFPRFGTF